MHFMTRLTGVATVADEVHGFSYFDNRDLLGFVDGTENPVDQAAVDATVIGDEDPAFAGGSYVIVQKYLHDLAGWNALPVETQERMVGRSKLSDIEMDESVKPSYAYTCLSDAPPGNYDRLLDFSRAVTGTLFFVPSSSWLDAISPAAEAPQGSSLKLGSLKGEMA